MTHCLNCGVAVCKCDRQDLKYAKKFALYLNHVLPVYEQSIPSKSHDGSCHPPVTDCDASCSDNYYANKDLNKIKQTLETFRCYLASLRK